MVSNGAQLVGPLIASEEDYLHSKLVVRTGVGDSDGSVFTLEAAGRPRRGEGSLDGQGRVPFGGGEGRAPLKEGIGWLLSEFLTCGVSLGDETCLERVTRPTRLSEASTGEEELLLARQHRRRSSTYIDLLFPLLYSICGPVGDGFVWGGEEEGLLLGVLQRSLKENSIACLHH